MSKKTVKRIQRIMRGIGVLGWCAFMLGCVWHMGGICPASHAAIWAGGGCIGMFFCLMFGGVLGGILK